MSKVQGRQVVGKLQKPDLPSVTSRAIDSFYVPPAPPVSPVLKELANSLSNLSPTLMRYAETKDLKVSKKEQADATKLYNENKLSFKEAVKKGLIPEGSNPYFIKQYLKLELEQKASDFTNELFLDYGDKNIAQNTDPNAFEGFFNQKFQDWRDENKLDFYDNVDLAENFFPIIQNGKDNLYSQHVQQRLGVLSDNAKRTFAENLFKKIDGAFNATLYDLHASMDMSGIESGKERMMFAVAEMQKVIDETDDSGMNIDDLNNIVRNTVVDYAVQSGDADILDILSELQQGTGSFADTLEGGKVIEQARDEISRDENFDITSYNLRKNYVEDIQQDKLDEKFLELVDNAKGVENLSSADFNTFVKETFTLEDGTTFKLTAEQRDRVYNLREKFINGALSTYNDQDYIQTIYKRMREDPYDSKLIEDIENAIGTDITVDMYRTLKADIKNAKIYNKHPYIQSQEYVDLETLIDNGITGFRTMMTTDNAGMLPLYVDIAQTDLHKDAMAMLGNPDNFKDGKFKYNIEEFQDLLRKKAIKKIIISLAKINSLGDQQAFDEKQQTYIKQIKELEDLLK